MIFRVFKLTNLQSGHLGDQDADDWLNFMLSQKNLWPTFTTRGTLTEEVSEQVFSKSGAASVDGGQAAVAGAC